jgi:hypothetical protein
MSDGKILSGQQFDPRGTMLVRRFTEQVQDYTKSVSPQTTGLEGTDGVEISPTDGAAAKIRTWNLTAIAAEYEASVIEFPGKVTVDLPDVLTSITATYNKSSGSGASNHPASQQFFNVLNSGSGNLSPKATTQGSAAIIADVIVNITNFRGIQVNCQHYYFYLTNTATLAQIIAKLGTIASCGTVTDLPIFKPETKQIKVYGGQVSIQQSANTNAALSFSSNKNNVITSTVRSFEYGDGNSKEIGVSTKVITIPPTIHAALSVGGLTTDTETVTVTVVANSLPIYINANIVVPTIINEPTPLQATVNAGVTPVSLSATVPSAIPTSGKYLVAHTGDIAEYGFTLIHAVVVDFAQYA